MSIEEIDTNGIPRICTLAKKVWPKTYKDILSGKQIAYMLDWMYSEDLLKKQIKELGHHFFIAKEESMDLGFCACEFNYKNQGITKIHKIYVLIGHQGSGVGKALINKVNELCINRGDHGITLNVNRQNSAEKFYEHLGFKKVREENIPIGNGFLMEDFVMEKTI